MCHFETSVTKSQVCLIYCYVQTPSVSGSCFRTLAVIVASDVVVFLRCYVKSQPFIYLPVHNNTRFGICLHSVGTHQRNLLSLWLWAGWPVLSHWPIWKLCFPKLTQLKVDSLCQRFFNYFLFCFMLHRLCGTDSFAKFGHQTYWHFQITHTHTRTHARRHARTHARTHAHTLCRKPTSWFSDRNLYSLMRLFWGRGVLCSFVSEQTHK